MSADMKAGRELDALIAERVMGWVWRRSNVTGRRCLYRENHWPEWMDQPADGSEPLVGDWDTVTCGNYSTDIAAAWMVVEKMRAADWWFCLTQDNTDIWDAKFWQGEPEGWFPRVEAYGHDIAAPVAICSAALKALDASRPPLPTGGETR